MRSTESSPAKSPVFIFDFGGVVIKWRNNNPIFDYIADRYGIPRLEMRRAFELALPRLETGEVSMRDFLEEVLGQFGKSVRKGDSPDGLWTLPFERLVKFRKGTVELVRSLRRRGYRVYLFSNTSLPHVRLLRRKKWDRLFDGFLSSCELRSMKPSATAFRRALAEIRRGALRGRLHRRQGGERQGRNRLWDTLGFQVHDRRSAPARDCAAGRVKARARIESQWLTGGAPLVTRLLEGG